MTKTARPLRLETNAHLEKPNRVGARSRKVPSLRLGEGVKRERFHFRSSTGRPAMLVAYNAEADAKQAELLMTGATINPKGFRTPSPKNGHCEGRRHTKRQLIRQFTALVVLAQNNGQSIAKPRADLNTVLAGRHPVTGEDI
jgi:hypothetical protein